MNNGGKLSIQSIALNPGWTIEKQETSGPEAEIDLKNGSQTVHFTAKIVNGVIYGAVQ